MTPAPANTPNTSPAASTASVLALGKSGVTVCWPPPANNSTTPAPPNTPNTSPAASTAICVGLYGDICCQPPDNESRQTPWPLRTAKTSPAASSATSVGGSEELGRVSAIWPPLARKLDDAGAGELAEHVAGRVHRH